MKVSRVNSSGRALPDETGEEAVALATGVSAATDVGAAEVAAGADAAALVGTADERIAEEAAVGVATAVPLDAAEVEGAGEALPEPPQVATGPPGAVKGE